MLDTRRLAVCIDGLPLGRILIRLDERYATGATLHEIHIGDGGKGSPNELHGRCGWVVGRSIVRIRFAFEVGIAFVEVGCSIFGVVHSTIGDKDVFAWLKDMMTFVGELKYLLDVDIVGLCGDDIGGCRTALHQAEVHACYIDGLVAVVVEFHETSSEVVLVVVVLAPRIIDLADEYRLLACTVGTEGKTCGIVDEYLVGQSSREDVGAVLHRFACCLHVLVGGDAPGGAYVVDVGNNIGESGRAVGICFGHIVVACAADQGDSLPSCQT